MHGTLTGSRAEGESASWENFNNRNTQSLLKALNHGTWIVQKHQWKLHNFLDVDCDVMLLLILGENKPEQFFQGIWLCSHILYLVVGKYVSKNALIQLWKIRGDSDIKEAETGGCVLNQGDTKINYSASSSFKALFHEELTPSQHISALWCLTWCWLLCSGPLCLVTSHSREGFCWRRGRVVCRETIPWHSSTGQELILSREI